VGRSFTSVRMGVRDLATRWERAARTLPGEERTYALRVAEMTRRHASECFYHLDDPLEAALFSVLLELEKGSGGVRRHVDP